MLSKNLIKKIRALHKKKARQEEGLFLVEGAKVVTELLHAQQHWNIHTLCASPEFIQQHQQLIQQAQIQPLSCDANQLNTLSSLSNNESALAVVALPQAAIPPQVLQGWVLVLDQINDPGNLGSLMRIADWYGIQHLVCSTNTVEAFNPKVISASKGSFLRVQLSYTDLATYLNQQTIQQTPILGAYLEGINLHKFSLPATKGILVLGSEAHGISEELEQFIGQKITIPSFGAAESLNVGVAAAVILDNLYRQLTP